MSTTALYKVDINGIVYLVDPKTAIAYTYDLTEPTEIGTVTHTETGQFDIVYRADWESVLSTKLDSIAVAAPPTAKDA